MHDAARNGKGLARLERDRFTLKFNIEMPFHDQEKLVGIVVLMPVEVTFHDAQADPSIVLGMHLTPPSTKSSSL